MTPYYERNGITIYCGDCLEVMPGLEPGSVGLVFVDWPYYKVKGEYWDRQWENPQKFLEWIDGTLSCIYKLLKFNGSLYGCASPKMCFEVEKTIRKYFNVINNIRWVHNGNTAKRADRTMLRGYLSFWEAIIFAEHYGTDNIAKGETLYHRKCDELRGFVFEPLRAYLDGERKRAGINFEQVRQIVGCADGSGLPSHWFTKSQWALPTEDNYKKLQAGFNQSCNGSGSQYLRREYEDLRREYEDLRREYEDLRRPFIVSEHVAYTDIWQFPTVKDYPGKHPTQKPLGMLEHIVTASTQPNAIIMDCCMGSGTTLVAAQNEGRRAIGIEISEEYCRIAVDRLRQPSFFSIPEPAQNGTQARQGVLIE